MLSQYLKSTWQQLRQQPVISLVTVAGTALAIFLIMLVVMIEQVRTAPFAPESNRDRFLHTYCLLFNNPSTNNNSISPFSNEVFKELYGDLKTPEAVSSYTFITSTQPVSVPNEPCFSVDVRGTDAAYWCVFDHEFVDGKPFDEAQFKAEQKVAVITESMARQLFGTTKCAGREFLMAYAPFKVCGVVKDVSTLAYFGYAQMWMPHSLNHDYDEFTGSLSVTILAKDRDDFGIIRDELKNRLATYNNKLEKSGTDILIKDFNQPYDQRKAMMIKLSANIEPDMEKADRTRFIIFLILLIVPAINLGSMTQSRYRQRVSEIGVRRAFGCTRMQLVSQLLGESLILTLAAGIIGLVLCMTFSFIASDVLFINSLPSISLAMPEVNILMLVHPSTFLWALFFCFILNLLSAGIPAWRASRMNIVNALEGSTLNKR